MGHTTTNRVATAMLFTALLAVTAPSMAVDSDLYLAGLGLHQETGRNIYLGGIYLEREAPRPSNLTEANGERIMEYRVIARRTSIRSLLGGMLLQSEVATGAPPDEATADFADRILSSVSSSLYAGDSLQVRLTEKNHTIALLNGVELARVSQKSVADYLLMGWVGDSGPSTSFRQNITAAEVDPSLLSELEATTYSSKRKREIARWIEPKAPAKKPAPVASKQAAQEVASGAETTAETAANALAATTALSETMAGSVIQGGPSSGSSLLELSSIESQEGAAAAADDETVTDPAAGLEQAAAVAAEASSDEETVQVASLVPMADMLPVSELEKDVQALGIQEYSQRLIAFHGQMVQQVYSEIRYPKRAVRRSLEGRLELDVTMTDQGKIVDIAVAVGSGHDLLDEAAVEAAEAAFKGGIAAVDPVAIAEFGDFSANRLTVPVPISFRLQ